MHKVFFQLGHWNVLIYLHVCDIHFGVSKVIHSAKYFFLSTDCEFVRLRQKCARHFVDVCLSVCRARVIPVSRLVCRIKLSLRNSSTDRSDDKRAKSSVKSVSPRLQWVSVSALRDLHTKTRSRTFSFSRVSFPCTQMSFQPLFVYIDFKETFLLRPPRNGCAFAALFYRWHSTAEVNLSDHIKQGLRIID